MTKSFSQLWIGAAIGLTVSLSTIGVQHFVNNKEKQTQLYLDEKKDFVQACDNYLQQYRQWHELMNDLIYTEDINQTQSKDFTLVYKKGVQILIMLTGKYTYYQIIHLE